MNRPTIAAINAHNKNGLCQGDGWRTDFSFYDHDKSTNAKFKIANDCENGVRPCADHTCYVLADGKNHELPKIETVNSRDDNAFDCPCEICGRSLAIGDEYVFMTDEDFDVQNYGYYMCRACSGM